MYFYFPSLWYKRNYVLFKQRFVLSRNLESNTELIKLSFSIEQQSTRAYPGNYVMLHMHEAITIIKILMQVQYPQIS